MRLHFILVLCVYIFMMCVCVIIHVSVDALVLWCGFRSQRTILGVGPCLPSCGKQPPSLLTSVSNNSWHMSFWDFSILASHLPAGVVGLQMCDICICFYVAAGHANSAPQTQLLGLIAVSFTFPKLLVILNVFPSVGLLCV